MPLSRNRKSVNPQKRKRIKQRKQFRNFAAQIPNQEILSAFLLSESDPFKRKAMFDLIQPHLKFKAEFPSRILNPGYEIHAT